MKKRLQQLIYAFALSALAALGGCAHGTAPTDQLANTEKTLSEARDANATISAPLELKLAEDNLKTAKAAMEKEDYDKARSFVERAQADADLALAKARSAKSEQVTKEMRDSIDALRKEIQRTEQPQTEETK